MDFFTLLAIVDQNAERTRGSVTNMKCIKTYLYILATHKHNQDPILPIVSTSLNRYTKWVWEKSSKHFFIYLKKKRYKLL